MIVIQTVQNLVFEPMLVLAREVLEQHQDFHQVMGLVESDLLWKLACAWPQTSIGEWSIDQLECRKLISWTPEGPWYLGATGSAPDSAGGRVDGRLN